jgi:hypothetical protein
MTSEVKISSDKKVYDLEERTALLGEGIIDFAKLNIPDKGNEF